MSDWSDFVQSNIANTETEEVITEAFAPVVSDVIVEIKGPDAAKLLQGQITADIEAIDKNGFCLGSLCTNKGRIVALFTILRTAEGFYCRLSKNSSEAFITTLKKYAVFYKVDIARRDDIGLLAVFSEQTSLNTGLAFAQLNHSDCLELWIEESQWQASVEYLQGKLQPADESLWQLEKIRQGWSDISAETLETFLPHALSLDLAEAISFTKGCYTGQEIIARTHYRGKPKKRLAHLVLASAPEKALIPGSDITDQDGSNLGNLVVSASYAGFNELLSTISLETPKKGTLVIEGQSFDYVTAPLPWSED